MPARIVIETHRIMGTDTISVPIDTKLNLKSNVDSDGEIWSTVSTHLENRFRCLGVTIPSGKLEIYYETAS